VPARPKTSRAEIVQAALDLINESGMEALSMLAVAERVGVRGPSLYKHFADRQALMGAVETHLFGLLAAELAGAAETSPGAAKRMAFAYRSFAKRNHRAYAMLFSSALSEREAVAASQKAAKPVLDVLRTMLANPEDALPAARAVTAFCHGFVSMELAGAFRLGGGIEEAFAEGVEIVLAGVLSRAGAAAQPKSGG
jgi:AcrR family transcriptional regulator